MSLPAPGPIRLVVSDLDGTLLRDDLTVSERVRAALRLTRDQGVPIILASGRMYRSVVPWACELGLDGPAICYQGAYVRELPPACPDPTTTAAAPAAPGAADPTATTAAPAGALLLHRPLAIPVARAAIRWCEGHGLGPHANIDDELVMARGDENAADYERASGVEARFLPDLAAGLLKPPTKILAVGPAGRPEALLEEARARFVGRAQVTVSHPEYLEFTAPGVTKGWAVRWLARRLGLPLESVMALGDQYNDLEMLEAVGQGVAMGGAPEPVRHAARYVTGTVGEDGAAQALEALVLGRGSPEVWA